MTDEDYRAFVQRSIDSLKELMTVEFLSVKNAQLDIKQCSKDQVDHVYETIKVFSFNTDKVLKAVDDRLTKIEAKQGLLWGGISVVAFLVPLLTGASLFLIDHWIKFK